MTLTLSINKKTNSFCYKMIDKIKIITKANSGTKRYLERGGRHSYKNGYTFYSGFLNNLKVKINMQDIVLIEGSLTKYYFGNNIKHLHTEEIGYAFQKLEDEIHLKLDDAEVKSIEFGRCFFMNDPIVNYIKDLGDADSYTDFGRYRNSITYFKRNQKLLLYDKLKECKMKRVKIPDFAKDNYVLRVEIALLNRLPDFFERNKITIELLRDTSFQSELLYFWFNEYRKINPLESLNFMPGFEPNNPRELKNAILYKGLESFGGKERFNNELDRIRARLIRNNNWSNSYDTAHYRMRAEVRKISKYQSYFEFSNLLDELDRKMISSLDEFWYSGGG